MKVLVLGCGPAGLIAARAAAAEGAQVKILSKARKSRMNGAQYLHRPIPGVDCGDPFEVDYRLVGTPQGYRFKVYGRQWDGTTSPEDMTDSHMAWDIRKAYDNLWDMFGSYVEEWEATPASLSNFIMRAMPDLVVSSVPAPLLCTQGHTFRASNIWSTDQNIAGIEGDNIVVCNGEESPRWYRAARIQGYDTVEWPDGVQPPVTPMWKVQKPLDHNCTCFPDLLRVGRYGLWKKGILSHETTEMVINKIKEIAA